MDAELGILLRIARMAGRDAPDVTELTSLEVNPDVDPVQFAPPPGSLISESLGEMLGAGGPLWWAGKAAAGLAAGGLGAWIRYSPFGHGQPRGGRRRRRGDSERRSGTRAVAGGRAFRAAGQRQGAAAAA